MGRALPAQRTVLELYEPPDQKFSTFQCIQPAIKFGQVLFLYRRSNLKGGKLEAEVNDSSTIAVIA